MAYDEKIKKLRKVANVLQQLVEDDGELRLEALATTDDEDGEFRINAVLLYEKPGGIV